MANRHKLFYEDYRQGRHDDADDEVVSPQTPTLEPGFSTANPPDLKPLPPPAAKQELRFDDDDELYPFEEFIDEYGPVVGKQRWDRARRAPAPERVASPAPKQPKPKKAQKNTKGNKVTAEELQEMMRRREQNPSPQNTVQSGGMTGMPKVSSTLRLDASSQPCSRSISPQSFRSSVRTVSPTCVPRHNVRGPIKSAALRTKGKVDGEALSHTHNLPAQQPALVADDAGKYRINVVVVGHVDAGKSTIMGHILFKLGLVPQKVIHKYEKESKANGKQSFHFAWVLDETDEERERGVTMDVAVSYFQTPTKQVTLLDCPGHRDFVSNMITGACQADSAVVVVNAVNGEFEAGFSASGQTKEHIMLLRSVGVSQLIIAVNKMDTVGYNVERFEAIKTELLEYLKKSGFKESKIRFIPVAGLQGENLVTAEDEKLLSWWKGGSLIDAIDTLDPPMRLVTYPARLCVSDVMKSMSLGNAVGGKISSGSFKIGDKVVLQPCNELATIKGIERAATMVDEACAGDNVEIGLSNIDPIHLTQGLVMCQQAESQVKVCQRLEATLVIFTDRIVTKSFQCIMHVQSNEVGAVINRLLARLDGKDDAANKKPRLLRKGQTGTVEIALQKPICVELGDEFRDLGRFMLRSNGETIAAGVVKKIFPLIKIA